MSLLKPLYIALLMTLSSISASYAGSSQWHDLGGGSARLIADIDPKTRKLYGAVEVRLEPGWSTYWRYPGSSGIPPNFDFSKSVNFINDKVGFPAPKLIELEDTRYAGYKTRVAFPFEGQVGESFKGKINLDLFIGVCSTICIPAQAQMSLDLRSLNQSDPVIKQTIQFAKKTVPVVKPANDVILDITYGDYRSLEIAVKHNSAYPKPSLFVEGPDKWYLQPARLVSREGDTAIFNLDIAHVPNDTDPMSKELRYTIVSGQQGIETRR